MATVTDKLNNVRARIDEVSAEAKAIADLSEAEDRDLSEQEETEFNSLTDQLNDLKAQEDSLEKRQERMSRLLQIRNELGESDDGGIHQPAKSNQMEVSPRIRVLSPQLRAFTGPTAVEDAKNTLMFVRMLTSRRRGFRDEEACNHVHNLGWDVRADMTEGTDTAGGYTVPTPLATAIIAVRNKVGLVPRIARVVPMTRDTLDWPKRTGGLTVYYPGEAGTITESQPSFGRVNLVAKKRATLTPISNELLADSAILIMDFLAEEIGNAFARQLDNEFINGDGTSTYGGVSGLITGIGSAGNTQAAAGDDTFSEVLDADLTTWFNTLPERFNIDGEVSILCSRQFHAGVFQRLAKANGVSFSDTESGLGPNYDGWPVVFTDHLPTSGTATTLTALFGNFRQAALVGDRGDMSIAESSEFGFDEDTMFVRATHRYDIKVHEKGDATNAGAYVSFTMGTA